MTGYNQIQKPLLPDYKAIKKYIKKIDATNNYSNFGPLYQHFKTRLESYWENSANVVITSSGTSALTAAVISKTRNHLASKKLCIVPNYTFVGTVAAIIEAGFTPVLFDTENDWDINISKILEFDRLDEVGLVMPVSIYGQNVDLGKWESFTTQTSIPVVIDAAASFDTISKEYLLKLKKCTICISLHATKAFGIGEGGLILSSTLEDESDFIRTINFGFFNSRNSTSASFNGKISEYHVAIGLASLDQWNKKLDQFKKIQELYVELSEIYKLEKNIICGPPISYPYCLFKNPTEIELEKLHKELTKKSIDFRLWYGNGISKHDYYRALDKNNLKNSEAMALSLVGIPMHLYLTYTDINHILTCLHGMVFK